MPFDQTLGDGLADRRGVIHIAQAKKTGARIIRAGLVSRRRKLHERMVLAHGDGFWRRRNLPNPRTRIVAGKSDCGLDFGVERKVFRLRQVDSAAREIDVETTLVRAAKSFRNAVRVAKEII